MRSIEALHRNKTGKVSDKWESYLGYYDSIFRSKCDDEVCLLEIGVQNGGSLETWSKYFERGRMFIGCDIDPNCASLTFDDPRVKVVVGDANSTLAFNEIGLLCKEFDIIIDDGSHVSMDIINSFINYFPLVKPGGIYIVEDTHTLYDARFGGGVLNEYSAYSFFKKLIDVVNFQFWKNDVSINTFFRTFFSATPVPDFIPSGWVESLEFRNSVITIRKSLALGHEKLGNRIISGQSAEVQTWGGAFSG